MATEPILRFSNGTDVVDILAPGSGWKMADPYWNPQIAQYKSGGIKINSALAEGQRLVHKEYDNVVETIPLSLSGTDQDRALKTLSDLLKLSRQSSDYWTESYEFDDVWMEARVACSSCYSGYARIVQMKIPELTNPYGQPFFGPFNQATMEGISLIVEREPLWRAVPPGEVIGPLYNLLKNPDFESWNNGTVDSQPDNWTDLETIQITGQNSRQSTAVFSGNYALKVQVTGSTLTGRIKGVTQTLANTRDNTTYTVVAWVRSEGVSNGVGRILVTYSGQLQVYRSNSRHGWTLYTGTFTTGFGDVVGINCEILSTAANTDGTVYFDGLMVLEGNWEQEAIDGVLPQITSSHITNHLDVPDLAIISTSDVNYLDVWNVPGNDDALVRLEVVNNTSPTNLTDPVEVISALRVGMRRAGNVFNFQNYQDLTGPLDSTASGLSVIKSGALSTTIWTTVASYNIQTPSITIDNQGRFRAIARIKDTRTSGLTTLLVRIRYWIGSAGTGIKTMDTVTVPILNNWCIVDLTPNAAINWDTKNRATPPSAFGFDIQMMRSANTDEGQLDYVMLIPTDGGCLFSDVDIPALQNEGVVVDNTFGSQDVFGARLISQWNPVSQTAPAATGQFQDELFDFNNALYIRATAGLGDIYRYKNNSMTLPITTTTIDTMASYNGKIYFFASGAPSNAYGTDGENFSPLVSSFTYGVGSSANKAIGVGGYLYIAGQDAGLSRAILYRWDGIAATATLLFSSATITGFTNMFVLGNYLYLSGQQGGTERIYTWNLTTGALTQILDTGVANNIWGIAEFNGKLYFTNQSDVIYVYDTANWTTQTPFPAFAPDYYGIGNIDGTLFIAGADVAAVPDRILVIKSTDGTTWSLDYHPTLTTTQRGASIAKSQGQLFLGTRSNGTIPAILYAKSITQNEYKVSDYQLLPFASPPKTRHRYFFNWDRENDINNVSDKALVGIGFVPRYLTLRGKF